MSTGESRRELPSIVIQYSPNQKGSNLQYCRQEICDWTSPAEESPCECSHVFVCMFFFSFFCDVVSTDSTRMDSPKLLTLPGEEIDFEPVEPEPVTETGTGKGTQAPAPEPLDQPRNPTPVPTGEDDLEPPLVSPDSPVVPTDAVDPSMVDEDEELYQVKLVDQACGPDVEMKYLRTVTGTTGKEQSQSQEPDVPTGDTAAPKPELMGVPDQGKAEPGKATAIAPKRKSPKGGDSVPGKVPEIRRVPLIRSIFKDSQDEVPATITRKPLEQRRRSLVPEMGTQLPPSPMPEVGTGTGNWVVTGEEDIMVWEGMTAETPTGEVTGGSTGETVNDIMTGPKFSKSRGVVDKRTGTGSVEGEPQRKKSGTPGSGPGHAGVFTGPDFVQEFNRAMSQPIGEPTVVGARLENLRGESGESTPDTGALRQVKLEPLPSGEQSGSVPEVMPGSTEGVSTDPMEVEGPPTEMTGSGHFSFLSVYTGIHMMEQDDCQSVHSARTAERTGPSTESVAGSLRSYRSGMSTASRWSSYARLVVDEDGKPTVPNRPLYLPSGHMIQLEEHNQVHELRKKKLDQLRNRIFCESDPRDWEASSAQKTAQLVIWNKCAETEAKGRFSLDWRPGTTTLKLYGLDEGTWNNTNLWDVDTDTWPYRIAVRCALPLESIRFKGGVVSQLLELNRNCCQMYQPGECPDVTEVDKRRKDSKVPNRLLTWFQTLLGRDRATSSRLAEFELLEELWEQLPDVQIFACSPLFWKVQSQLYKQSKGLLPSGWELHPRFSETLQKIQAYDPERFWKGWRYSFSRCAVMTHHRLTLAPQQKPEDILKLQAGILIRMAWYLRELHTLDPRSKLYHEKVLNMHWYDPKDPGVLLIDFGEILADCQRPECGGKQVVVAHVTGFLRRDRFHVSDCCHSDRERRLGLQDTGNSQRSMYGNHVVLVIHHHILALKLTVAVGTPDVLKDRAAMMQPLDPRLLLLVEKYLTGTGDEDDRERYEVAVSIDQQYKRWRDATGFGKGKSGGKGGQDWNRPQYPAYRRDDWYWKQSPAERLHQFARGEELKPGEVDETETLSDELPEDPDQWIVPTVTGVRTGRPHRMGRVDSRMPRSASVPRRDWDQEEDDDREDLPNKGRPSRTWNAVEPIPTDTVKPPACFRCNRPGALVHACSKNDHVTGKWRSRMVVYCWHCTEVLRGLCWGTLRDLDGDIRPLHCRHCGSKAFFADCAMIQCPEGGRSLFSAMSTLKAGGGTGRRQDVWKWYQLFCSRATPLLVAAKDLGLIPDIPGPSGMPSMTKNFINVDNTVRQDPQFEHFDGMSANDQWVLGRVAICEYTHQFHQYVCDYVFWMYVQSKLLGVDFDSWVRTDFNTPQFLVQPRDATEAEAEWWEIVTGPGRTGGRLLSEWYFPDRLHSLEGAESSGFCENVYHLMHRLPSIWTGPLMSATSIWLQKLTNEVDGKSDSTGTADTEIPFSDVGLVRLLRLVCKKTEEILLIRLKETDGPN